MTEITVHGGHILYNRLFKVILINNTAVGCEAWTRFAVQLMSCDAFCDLRVDALLVFGLDKRKLNLRNSMINVAPVVHSYP